MSKVIHPDRGEELIDLALETYTAREADAGLEDQGVKVGKVGDTGQ